MEYPKLLIICHNLYEDTNNIGKTLVSLLNKWPKDKLCQIYLREDSPSFKYCNEYYKITDSEVFHHVFKRKQQVGAEVTDEKKTNNESEEKYYQIGNKRYPIVSFIRDTLWSGKSWKNASLDKWLEKVKPDLILFVPNDYKLIYPIVEYVSSSLNIPIVPYYMDDAFYSAGSISLIDSIRRRNIRKEANKLLHKYNEIFCISPKMSEEYSKQYGVTCTTLMNSVSFGKEFYKESNSLKTFSYVGNLHSNRWKSIIDIGKALLKVDKTYSINVYTQSSLSKKVLKKIKKVPNVQLKGSVKPSEIFNVFNNSEYLLFVESFDRKSVLSTRLSLSTKIPEYLASKTPIFAFGPKNISSIEYLKKNALSFVCSDKKELVACLSNMLKTNKDEMVERGYSFAKQTHDIEKNSLLFCETILYLYKKWGHHE